MSCHKVSRALLERFRFGELDASCEPYLRHVESCPECQEEIALDRHLARQLRRALSDRVESFEPSPAVWRAVRLVAADPEPPKPWWAATAISLGHAMRVMVPAAAVVLAAVLTWAGPEVGSGEAASIASPLASRLQWQEQLDATAVVERPRGILEPIPGPSIQMPRPAGDMPFPEPVRAIKIPIGPPTTGGVIK